MNVAIIGAGITGLSAARELMKAGIQPIIFEKSRGVGGRVATRRLEGFTFDTGAQSIAAQACPLTKVILEELDTTELVQIAKPIYTHESLHVSPGDPRRNTTPRYTYTTGNSKLAKLLAAGLDVRLETSVETITRVGEAYEVNGETFDAVILTMPVPQASLLLWALDERRPTATSRYRSCLSVLLGFNHPTPDLPYHAVINLEGGHPLQWLCFESIKSPGRAPEGTTALIAQLSAGFSQSAWAWENTRIVETVCAYLARLYGPAWIRPDVSDVMKWKYSQPEAVLSFESVNRPGKRLVLAGDGLAGARVEYAFNSGLQAAQHVLENK